MANDEMTVPHDDADVDLDGDDSATSALQEQKVRCASDLRTSCLQSSAAKLGGSFIAVSCTQVGETVDLTNSKDGGVMKKLLTKGKGWKRPETGDEVFGTPPQTLSDHPVTAAFACGSELARKKIPEDVMSSASRSALHRQAHRRD